MRHEDRTVNLDELCDRHAADLYAYACLLSRSPDEARDAVQNTFLNLARRPERLAQARNPRAYLFAVLRNEAFACRSRWRRWWSGDLAAGTVRFADRTDSTNADTLDRPDPDAVSRAMADLPPDQREVLFLKLWQNMTFAEIADLLAISANTAASRYRYAIEKLRESLGHDA